MSLMRWQNDRSSGAGCAHGIEMEEKEKEIKETENESNDDDIFKIEEVKIEEMAIDGICGVY